MRQSRRTAPTETSKTSADSSKLSPSKNRNSMIAVLPFDPLSINQPHEDFVDQRHGAPVDAFPAKPAVSVTRAPPDLFRSRQSGFVIFGGVAGSIATPGHGKKSPLKVAQGRGFSHCARFAEHYFSKYFGN